ncbi:MAG: LytTR family transcriptional regulator DNA-binding domain-containing protein, partial [Bacteroidota bacterium]
FASKAALEVKILHLEAENREYVEGQRVFLYWLLFLSLAGVLLPYMITGDIALRDYFVYTLAIFCFYFFRRVEYFSWKEWNLLTQTEYFFEAIWTPVLLITYQRFLYSYLGLKKEIGKTYLSFSLRLLGSISWLALLTTLIVMFFYGVTAGCAFARNLLWLYCLLAVPVIILILRRKDTAARVVAGGVFCLILGVALVQLNDFLRSQYSVDIKVGHLSYGQIGVGAELLFYWLGLAYRVYEGRRQYLLRSVEVEQLRGDRESLTHQLADVREVVLTIDTKRKIYRWARPQVQGFVAEREVCRVLLQDRADVTIPLRLKEVIAQLPEGFVRIHRSYVVLLSAVEVLRRGKQIKVW